MAELGTEKLVCVDEAAETVVPLEAAGPPADGRCCGRDSKYLRAGDGRDSNRDDGGRDHPARQLRRRRRRERRWLLLLLADEEGLRRRGSREGGTHSSSLPSAEHRSQLHEDTRQAVEGTDSSKKASLS
jgi:hypothetical protein